MLQQVFQQPAAAMNSEMEIRIAVEYTQERSVTPQMSIIQHVGKVTDRLVCVYPKK